jgi:hypothetical protein
MFATSVRSGPSKRARTFAIPRIALALAAFAAVSAWSGSASADVWFELLHAPCWTGSADDITDPNGEVPGSIDCFNKDFNGDVSRTLLSIKAFQPWKYGFVFLYYDITGPFTRAGLSVTDNEKGGFFGGTTVAISPKRIAEKLSGATYDWGPLTDIYVKYEAEHVSKFGMLHYYGLAYDFKVPHMDFVSATTVIRDDRAFKGVDLQLGAAWQKTFNFAGQSILFGGFFQWGLFGEGDAPKLGDFKGRPFFLSQPQLLYDLGKLVRYDPNKIWVGFEYQLAFNRYLISGKTENVLQGMIRWNP